MKLFEGKFPERDFSPVGGDFDYREIESLVRMLMRGGVFHETQKMGPFRGVVFESPHGMVSVMVGPGSVGGERGLLEAYCEGWDMSPRGDLTAHQVYDDYMHGGW